MSGNEMKFIEEAFAQNWVVPLGPNVDGFEKDLEEFVNRREGAAPLDRRVVALSAGTARIRQQVCPGRGRHHAPHRKAFQDSPLLSM